MKRNVFCLPAAIVSLLFCFLFLTSCVWAQEEPQENRLLKQSAVLADALVKGNFEAVYRHCTPEMQATRTPEKMKISFDVAVRGLGAYREPGTGKFEEGIGGPSVTVTAGYEHGRLALIFAYNDSGMLRMLSYRREMLRPALRFNEKIREKAFRLGAAEAPVDGILTVPAGNEPIKYTAILVPGMFAQSMDYTLDRGQGRPSRDLSDGLAEQGIAVVRYNKRTYQYPDISSAEDFSVEKELLGDMRLAIEFAGEEKTLSESSLILIGYDLGGSLALKTAAENRAVAGVVLLGSSPRPLEEVLAAQTKTMLTLFLRGEPQKSREAAGRIDDMAAQVKNINAAGAEESYFGLPQSYWLSLHNEDFVRSGNGVKVPVLVLQGSDDPIVSPEKDFKQWKRLFSGCSNWTFTLYPGLNHFFMGVQGARLSGGYEDPARFSRKVILDIAQWIKRMER